MSGQSGESRLLAVFLCHSSGDKEAVRSLYRDLSREGIKPWLDEEDLLPGQEWEPAIQRAVSRSDIVIACLSRDAITKEGFVQKEIKIALDEADKKPEGTIFIIPVKLEECEVPDRLRRWQWVDFFHERGYERLMQALRVRAEHVGASIGASKSQIPSAIDLLTPAEVNPTQLASVAAVSNPREQALADLDEVLPEIAQRKWQLLPGYFGRLQYIFNRLGRDEDAAWCQAELHGYTPENTPRYRYANVTITRRWIGDRGIGGTVYMTGSGTRSEERTELIPFNDPVSDLRRMTTNKTTRASKEEIPWREEVVTIPRAVQGVLERILSECYSRAFAAYRDETT